MVELGMSDHVRDLAGHRGVMELICTELSCSEQKDEGIVEGHMWHA